MFEFPCLDIRNRHPKDITPSPYGLTPPSSLFRTLWKSYLKSERVPHTWHTCSTAEQNSRNSNVWNAVAKHSSWTHYSTRAHQVSILIAPGAGRCKHTSRTIKLSPISLQRTTCWYDVSSSILAKVSTSSLGKLFQHTWTIFWPRIHALVHITNRQGNPVAEKSKVSTWRDCRVNLQSRLTTLVVPGLPFLSG